MKFKTEADRIRYEENYLPAYNALMKCYPFALDAIDDEEWKPIAGYEKFYHVSTYGRIKSFKQRRTGKILKPQLDIGGYLRVGLSLDGKQKPFSVHILVATAFIPNPDNKPEVNHRIGWKLNCYVGNLEWATHEENMEHAVRTGLAKIKGTENSQAKIQDEEIILYIRNNPDNLSRKELAEKFGVDETLISLIQTGKLWRHVGGNIRKSKCPRVSDEQREEIRIKFATGNFTQSQLAEMYNVCQQTVSRIINE